MTIKYCDFCGVRKDSSMMTLTIASGSVDRWDICEVCRDHLDAVARVKEWARVAPPKSIAGEPRGNS